MRLHPGDQTKGTLSDCPSVGVRVPAQVTSQAPCAVQGNTTLLLKLAPLQVNKCGSAFKAFQGLYSYSFSVYIFPFEQEESLKWKKKKKKYVPLIFCQTFGRNMNFMHYKSSR